MPHGLPDTVAMLRLIHDLPLRSADDGSGPDDMYLRVLQASQLGAHAPCTPAHAGLRGCTEMKYQSKLLGRRHLVVSHADPSTTPPARWSQKSLPFQVPERYVFDNMFYKWDIRSRVSPPSDVLLPTCVPAATCALQSFHRRPAAIAAVCCASLQRTGIHQCAYFRAHHTMCWTLTPSGLESCRQMVVRERGGGVYRVFTHEGFWRQRTPRPLYWKARVVQGSDRGSRDLVRRPTLWQYQQAPPLHGRARLSWAARRTCHMRADSAPACEHRACWQSTAGISATQGSPVVLLHAADLSRHSLAHRTAASAARLRTNQPS